MKLKDLSKLRKLLLPLIAALIFTTIGIILTPGTTEGSGLRKLDFRDGYSPMLESAGLTPLPPGGQPDLPMSQIKGEVLSLAASVKGVDGLTESFIYVKNAGQIGENVVVVFMPNAMSQIFATALAGDLDILVWGSEISPPEEYSEITSKAFIVFAARALSDDVPGGFSDLGVFYNSDEPSVQKEIVEIKP